MRCSLLKTSGQGHGGDGRPGLPMRGHIPQPRRPVVSGRGQDPAVRAERHPRLIAEVGVAGEVEGRADPPARGRIPQADCPVPLGHGQDPAARAEGHRRHRASGLGLEGGDRAPGQDVEHARAGRCRGHDLPGSSRELGCGDQVGRVELLTFRGELVGGGQSALVVSVPGRRGGQARAGQGGGQQDQQGRDGHPALADPAMVGVVAGVEKLCFGAVQGRIAVRVGRPGIGRALDGRQLRAAVQYVRRSVTAPRLGVLGELAVQDPAGLGQQRQQAGGVAGTRGPQVAQDGFGQARLEMQARGTGRAGNGQPQLRIGHRLDHEQLVVPHRGGQFGEGAAAVQAITPDGQHHQRWRCFGGAARIRGHRVQRGDEPLAGLWSELRVNSCSNWSAVSTSRGPPAAGGPGHVRRWPGRPGGQPRGPGPGPG